VTDGSADKGGVTTNAADAASMVRRVIFSKGSSRILRIVFC